MCLLDVLSFKGGSESAISDVSSIQCIKGCLSSGHMCSSSLTVSLNENVTVITKPMPIIKTGTLTFDSFLSL